MAERDPCDPHFNVLEEINKTLLDQNKRPWRRRKSAYHPSAMSGCKRAIYYDRVGEEPKQNIQAPLRMLFGLGHAIHDFIQGLLREDENFKAEVVAKYDALNIYGSCDGVWSNKGWLLEIKTIGDSSFRTLVKPKKEHIRQAHCYMKALDIPRTQLLYVNRDTGQMRLFRTHFDEDVWGWIEDVIEFVENHIKNKTAPPKEESYFYCRSCKFAHVCKPVY
ncbi:MAG: hypothetical protein CMA70_04770 [Euryarchaeota archaeon]|nr:hypothetical protein [Euryarchaeota archaeon]